MGRKESSEEKYVWNDLVKVYVTGAREVPLFVSVTRGKSGAF